MPPRSKLQPLVEPPQAPPPRVSAARRSTAAPRQRSSELLTLAALFGVLLLALVPRLLILAASNFNIDADEAIVGLMAKHFSEGRPWQVFYYGQAYMGSLEPLLAALAFSFLGAGNAALKLVPLIFAVIQVLLTYALARRLMGPALSLAAALLAAIAPHALVSWSIMARGGFIELVVIGTLALILAVDMLGKRELRLRDAAPLGFVLGVGWWVNNQIVFYMTAIGLVVGLHLLRQGMRQLLLGAAIIFAGFFLGGAPFWYANITGSPRWESFTVLFGGNGGGHALDHFHGLVYFALPIILGARRFWTEVDLFNGASLLAYGVYGFALLALCARIVGERGPRRYAAALFLLFIAATGLIFSLSSFGWLFLAPRYLLPLYSVLFVVLAWAIELCLRGGIVGRCLGAALFAAALGLNLGSLYAKGGLRIPQPVVFAAERVAQDQSALYSWLREQGHRHVYTNYWIGYRMAFETAEEITFSRFGRPRTIRIPEYEQQDRSFAERVFVLVPGEAQLLTRELEQFGWQYRRTEVGSYVVIDRLCRKWLAGEELALRPGQLTASSQEGTVANALDGDPATRWGSGKPQHPGMFIHVEFDGEQTVSGVSVDLGRYIHDAPRRLVVWGESPADGSLLLFDSAGTKTANDLKDQEFAEVPVRWDIMFAPVRLTALRLEQLASAPVFDWSVAELAIYGRPEPADGVNDACTQASPG